MPKTKLHMLIDQTITNCEVRKDEADRSRRPKNATIRAIEFNESVAIDLTEWWNEKDKNKHILCHMGDEYSRLSVAEMIEDKKPETVLNVIMRRWICVFGTPKRILHDRGGEFQNAQLLNFLNVMVLQSRPTSAYSPFTNGVVERHNGVLKTTLDKVINDYDYIENKHVRTNTALCHALNAKNALLDYHGYSPFMRVYGRQGISIPGIEHDNVTIQDEWVKKQFEGIQKVREAYLQADSDERIRAALKRKADTYHPPIPLGTDVLFYRDGQKCEKGWNGPGKVIDRTGSDYTIKHGKQLTSAHARDVRKFLTRKRFEEIDESESENISTKPLMTNDKANDDYQFLINRKQEIKHNVKCQLCKRHSTCMRILAKNMNAKQTNKAWTA